MPRKQLIQQRRDTAANWTAANPTLAAGEIGFETDTGKFKVGDGSTAWSSLTYFVAGAGGSGAPTDASYVTLGTNGTLSAERVLTAGTGIDITDAGAGSTVTVDVDPSEFGNGTVPIASLASTPLLASNNLSDVTAATARTNLGLGSLATLSAVGSSEIANGAIVNDDVNASAAIALSKLASIATARLLGRTTAGSGAIEELTQASVFGFLGTGTPGSGNFLRGDGTWTAPAGGGWPHFVTIVPWLGSVSNTNFDARSVNTAALGAGYLNSSGAQNAEVTFRVALDAGTWSFKIIHASSTGGGIYTVRVDGSTIGTVDSYNGSTTYNNVGTIAGWTVSTGGVYDLNLKMETKHASSSNYYGFVQLLALYRTGA